MKNNSITISNYISYFKTLVVAILFGSSIILLASLPYGNRQLVHGASTEVNEFGFAGGDGRSAESAFLITNAEQLDNVRNYLGNSETGVRYYFKQIADISLKTFLNDSDCGWIPIGFSNSLGEYFYGEYDGGFYEITGLWCFTPQDTYAGLFGFVESSKIQRIKLTLAVTGIVGGEFLGGIAGQISESTIENCQVKGTIKVDGVAEEPADIYAGGLTGQAINSSIISNCYYEGTIIDTTDQRRFDEGSGSCGFGGITGYIDLSRIVNCYANISVDQVYGINSLKVSGGLIGVHGLDSAVENCLAAISSIGQVFPITAGISEGWLGFGAQPKLKIIGSYTFYSESSTKISDIHAVPDARGLNTDDYSRVITASELSNRDTYIGTNGLTWDFTSVWGFSSDNKILLRVFGGAYDRPEPPKLTWLWVSLAFALVAVGAVTGLLLINKHKKPVIVKETETIIETRHVYISDESQPLPSDLTPKEREVAALLLEWKSRRDIVEILGVSANAVNFHIKNIYDKCDCHSHKEFIVKYGTEKK